VAWLDLTARLERGDAVDAKSIRKHANDVFRLAQLLAPETRITVVERIGKDLARFLARIAAEPAMDPAALGLAGTQAEIAERIRRAYGIPS
jgi:hypothetical protein